MSFDFNYATPSSGCQRYLPLFKVRKWDQVHLLNIIRRKIPNQFYQNESAARALCTPSGYNLYDHPRSGRCGGGTGVLFQENLRVSKGEAAELESFEYSEWNVTSGTQRIHLIIVYGPPYSETHPVMTSVLFTEFAQFLDSAVHCTDHLVISGDFNIHMDVPDDPDAIKLRELLETTGLVQHVTVPTHISMHTLDLIITRHSDRICVSPP